MTRSKIVVATAAALFTILFTIPGILGAAADSPPRIDVEKVCRSRVQAVGQIGDRTQAQALTSCVKAEQDAQAAIAEAWEKIPARYKTECIKPNVHSPSYSEWIACLELLIDVKAARSKSNN